MLTMVVKEDLSPTSFVNNNTNAAGGIGIRVDAGSVVATAIVDALAALPDASGTGRGLVELALAGDYPQHTDDGKAASPAYVKAAIDDVPLWSTSGHGLVTKADAAKATQDIGLPLGNGVGGPAIGVLDDSAGVTVADIYRGINANHRQYAKTWSVPSVRFPTVGSLLLHLSDRHLVGVQTINVAAGVLVEPANWTIHPQPHMIKIVGQALSSPVTPADRVFTGWTAADLTNDIASTKAALAAKVPTQITFTPARTLTSAAGMGMYSMSNILFDGLTISATGAATHEFLNVFFMNGALNYFESAPSLYFSWAISSAATALVVRRGSLVMVGGVYRGSNRGIWTSAAAVYARANAGYDIVGMGPVNGYYQSDLGNAFFTPFAVGTAIRWLSNTAGAGGNGMGVASGQVCIAGPAGSTFECVGGTGIRLGIGSRVVSDQASANVSLRLEGTTGYSIHMDDGSHMVVPVGGTAGHQFIVGSNNEHIRMDQHVSLIFTGAISSFTGGTPTINLSAAAMTRVTLRGTVLPLGANIPLNLAAANGAHVQS